MGLILVPNEGKYTYSIFTLNADMVTSHGNGPLRIAVLDDYQNVALTNADWTVLYDKATIYVFNDALYPDYVTTRLQDYDIICAMRERTKFPSLVLERLPNLKSVHLCIHISLLSYSYIGFSLRLE